MVEQIEAACTVRLGQLTETIGRTTHTGLDDAFYLTQTAAATRGLATSSVPVVLGEDVRDYHISAPLVTLFPYTDDGSPRALTKSEVHAYWPNRTVLRRRIDFGQTPTQRGLRWFDHSMFFPKRYQARLSIALAEITTHNHFALDRSGSVFNRTAPVIKLKDGATEHDYLHLLGILNSSSAGFWLKQVCFDKGNGGIGGGISDEFWEHRFVYNGSNIQMLPIPSGDPGPLASELDTLARQLAKASPGSLASEGNLTRSALSAARQEWELTRARLVALQEELDWQVYSLYNLVPDGDLCLLNFGDVPPLALGERAFEILLARRIKAGKASSEWFTRHSSTSITELPSHWSDEYKAVVNARITAIENSRAINLIERPEYKRRWQTDDWNKLQEQVLREWLLKRTEARHLWYVYDENGIEQPRVQTISSLLSELTQDEGFISVAALYAPQRDLADTVAVLLADEHVPFLSALRYKSTGMTKRAQWEEVWTEQRHEDAAPDELSRRKIRDAIPVPPKYTSADFLKPSYWKARGKLDVPKERFVSYLSPPFWAGPAGITVSRRRPSPYTSPSAIRTVRTGTNSSPCSLACSNSSRG